MPLGSRNSTADVSTTVYTQSETPNETYGEYIFSAPNELGNAISAHTSNTVTANGITYTRNSASDNYTKVNSFYYTIDTTKYSSSYTTGYAPFSTGTYTSLVGKTITIDWGDNSTTIITDGVISSSTNQHTYASAGEYNIRITSTGDFPEVDFFDAFGYIYMKLVTKVKSVIPKCKNTSGNNLTSFSSCFYNCSGLTSIPENLFKYNTAVTTFSTCFYGCTGLTSIPTGLFDNSTAVTYFGGCFHGCSGLTSVPAYLFRYNIAVTSFLYCFAGCTKLQLNSNIFCDESTEMATRFSNVTPNFSYCFQISSFSGTQGTAPQLWNYTYSGTPTSTSCFSGQSATSLTNYLSIPSAWDEPA